MTFTYKDTHEHVHTAIPECVSEFIYSVEVEVQPS